MTARRILIADDDPLLRALLVHRLSADGHEVLTAEDGGEALAAISEQRPDLIVLDALMPVMDGFEVLRRIKAGGVTDAPVIMLTALKREQDVVGGLQLGAADYLVKPFIPDELSQRVRRLLQPSERESWDEHLANACSGRGCWIPGTRFRADVMESRFTRLAAFALHAGCPCPGRGRGPAGGFARPG